MADSSSSPSSSSSASASASSSCAAMRAARPLIVGSEAPERPYPIYLRGDVERGFGRGGKELGCPTANLPTRALASSPALSRTGIYFGFARVLPQDAEDPDIAQAGEEHLTHPAGAREDQLAAAAAAASDEEWNDDSVVLGASPPPPHTQSAEAGFAEYLDARDASAAEGAGGPAPAAAAAAAAAGQKPRQMSAAAGRSVGSVMERVATTQGGGGGTPHAHQDGASPRPLDADASTQASSRDDGGAPSASSRRGKLKKPRVHLAEQDRGVYPFVMSLGYNPFYGNTQRTGEVHIMHQFASDFYGLEQRVVILGYLRPEYNYETREGLIEDIETDKRVALASLRRPLWQAYASDPFLGPGPGAE